MIGVKEFNRKFKQIKAFDSTVMDISTSLHYYKAIPVIKMSTL